MRLGTSEWRRVGVRYGTAAALAIMVFVTIGPRASAEPLKNSGTPDAVVGIPVLPRPKFKPTVVVPKDQPFRPGRHLLDGASVAPENARSIIESRPVDPSQITIPPKSRQKARSDLTDRIPNSDSAVRHEKSPISGARMAGPSPLSSGGGTGQALALTEGGVQGPDSIAELARALNYDAGKIFEWVLKNTEPTWMFGLQKGALGALIDGTGTPFDLAQLTVSLLRESGYTANYLYGEVQIAAADVDPMFNVDSGDDACTAGSMFSRGESPTLPT